MPKAASLDFILKWMPLKADRGLPGDLVTAMQSAGWVRVAQVKSPISFVAVTVRIGDDVVKDVELCRAIIEDIEMSACYMEPVL